MNENEVIAIATVTKNQLISSTNINVLFSWRLGKLTAVLFNDMATLKFKVNGRLFQGYVLISYNSLDYYDIYLSNAQGTRSICENASSDMLVDVIDTAVESGTDKKEYKEFCLQERAKLFSGQF